MEKDDFYIFTVGMVVEELSFLIANEDLRMYL